MMVVLRAGALVLLLTFGVMVGLSWAAPAAGWKVTPDPARVGDQLTARLWVEHGADTTVRWPDPAPTFAPLSLAATGTLADQPLADGRVRSTQTYRLDANLPGNVRLPGTTVTLSDGSRAQAAAISVVINGMFDGPPPDPAPARPPAGVAVSPVWWLLALALLAGIAFAIYRWRQRPLTVAAAPAVPAHQSALAALSQLEQSDLPDDLRLARLSLITRRYLAERYGIDAPTRTTSEVLPLLSTGPQAGDFQPLLTWLPRWDAVKFAGLPTAPDEVVHQLQAVRRWIKQTAGGAS